MSLFKKATVSAAILAGSTAFVGQSVEAGTNIITNGSFETNESWDDGALTGWGTYTHSGATTGNEYEGNKP